MTNGEKFTFEIEVYTDRNIELSDAVNMVRDALHKDLMKWFESKEEPGSGDFVGPVTMISMRAARRES